MQSDLNSGLTAAVALGALGTAASYNIVDSEKEVVLDPGFVDLKAPRHSPVGQGTGTKKGGYAVEARLNGANKRARAARKINRRTRNGQHL